MSSKVANMHTRLLDAFTDLSGWMPVMSGQARLVLRAEPAPRGQAMRLDFDFGDGGGFVVARKPFAFTLPESFTFHLDVRAAAPSNRFEFKLVDPAGVNVWRYEDAAFDFESDWRTLSIPGSRIDFAWGPAGGGAPTEVGAIEFAVAAGPGGRGSLWIADLRLEDRTPRAPPRLQASGALPGHDPACAMDGRADTCWRAAPGAGPAWLEIDFGQVREYGGLILRWAPQPRERTFTLQGSDDGSHWRPLYTAARCAGETSYVYLPNGASRHLHLQVDAVGAAERPALIAVEVQPFDFSRSINTFFHHVAGHGARGHYPRWLSREQSYWTPVDIPDGADAALLNEDGLLEVDRGSFSLEPFLYANGVLLGWADVALSQALEGDNLPLPSSAWRHGDVTLTTTAFAAGSPGEAVLGVRYRVESRDVCRAVVLFSAVRPLQVTPTWQSFEELGGMSPVRELDYREGVVWVNGAKAVIPLRAADGFGAATFDQGAVTEYLARGVLPPDMRVNDGFGYASGALRFDLEPAPGAPAEVFIAIPFGPADAATVARVRGISGTAGFESAVRTWSERLGRVDFRVPPPGRAYRDSCRGATAHILINRDGPALHPGPRRYTRSWIRDGAVMAAALLRMGLNDEAGAFVRWYARFQRGDGNVPCCVDRKGPDWLPEHDSHGEFIYAVAEHYRFSGDRRLAGELWPAVRRAVAWLEKLRGERLTPAYREPERIACYGLLPESVSHEGYLAQPVHAYWDDFWALRGFKDAALLAQAMGDAAEAGRLAALAEDFRATLCDSLRRVMDTRGIDFLPGSVEWADPDPTAVANALTLVDEAQALPSAALAATFDRFLDRFRAMHAGQVPWTNYTPYEIRIIGALLRLGRRREAHELARFFLGERRPPAWNQWPEIAWRDPRTPGHQGDLPHSWIGAEYVLVFRDLIAFEREADESLVVAAGIPGDWLAAGEVAVSGLPTWYGRLDVRLRRTAAGEVHLSLGGDMRLPPGGFRFAPELAGPLREVRVNGAPSTDFTPTEVCIRMFPAEVVVDFHV
jgi:hypothetical protein